MPKNGRPDPNHLAYRVDQVSLPQLGHRIPESPHAGKNQFLRLGDSSWIAADRRLVTHPFEPLLHAAQISHLVIDDHNHSEPSICGYHLVKPSNSGLQDGLNLTPHKSAADRMVHDFRARLPISPSAPLDHPGQTWLILGVRR
jgi:hypothetical protein